MTRKSKTVTQEQRMIIEHNGSHALVKAVPGSGKTTTLVKRVQHLLKNGVLPEQIMVLMYNKAAKVSFTEKLALTLKNEYSLPPVRTFHGLALNIVQHAERRGWLSKKKLLKPEMAQYVSIIREAYRYGYVLEDGFIESSDVEELELFMARCHAEGLAPEEVTFDPIFAESPKEHIKAYTRFCELLQDNNFRTFDSMLTEAKQVIAEQPHLFSQLSHVIVDEYQDVNLVQHEIIKLLAGHQASVMAVGDINQSIYEWRGSRPDFIDGIFEQQFKPVKVFYLSCSFRFGHQLSLIANYLIGKNTHKTAKLCISQPTETPRTEVSIHSGLCLSKVSTLLTTGDNSTAILSRTNAHLAEAELALRLSYIPYAYPDEKADGSINIEKTTLFKRKEICVLVAAFLMCIDGDLNRLTQHPQRKSILAGFLWDSGITWTKGQMKDVHTKFLHQNADIWRLVSDVLQNGRKHRLKLNDFLSLKGSALASDLAFNVYQKIALAGITENIDQESSIRRESNDQRRGMFRIKEFLQSSGITVGEFLSALLEPQKTNTEVCPVTLATFHAAKGLEYDTVIITGLDDAEFPPSPPHDKLSFFETTNVADATSLDEERRLIYVGITRAKRHLHLLVPPDENLIRWINNGWNTTPNKAIASRFVYELGISEAKKVSEAIYDGTAKNLAMNKLPSWYLKELARLH